MQETRYLNVFGDPLFCGKKRIRRAIWNNKDLRMSVYAGLFEAAAKLVTLRVGQALSWGPGITLLGGAATAGVRMLVLRQWQQKGFGDYPHMYVIDTTPTDNPVYTQYDSAFIHESRSISKKAMRWAVGVTALSVLAVGMKLLSPLFAVLFAPPLVHVARMYNNWAHVSSGAYTLVLRDRLTAADQQNAAQQKVQQNAQEAPFSRRAVYALRG